MFRTLILWLFETSHVSSQIRNEHDILTLNFQEVLNIARLCVKWSDVTSRGAGPTTASISERNAPAPDAHVTRDAPVLEVSRPSGA